ncbi:hypothetical protein Hanom_Chr13g01233451 [Helianthus anomalus]
MEGLTTKVYNIVKSHWRRRGYHRLGTTTNTIVHGDHEEKSKPRRRRKWRVRIPPRLKLKLARSPQKLFIRLRDAYVQLMMKLANTSAVRGRTMIGCNGDGYGKMMIKEYDEKIVIEIYKNVVIGKDHQHQSSSHNVCYI